MSWAFFYLSDRISRSDSLSPSRVFPSRRTLPWGWGSSGTPWPPTQTSGPPSTSSGGSTVRQRRTEKLEQEARLFVTHSHPLWLFLHQVASRWEATAGGDTTTRSPCPSWRRCCGGSAWTRCTKPSPSSWTRWPNSRARPGRRGETPIIHTRHDDRLQRAEHTQNLMMMMMMMNDSRVLISLQDLNECDI